MATSKSPNPVEEVGALLDAAAAKGRHLLLEPEIYSVLSLLSLETPPHRFIKADEKASFRKTLRLPKGDKAVKGRAEGSPLARVLKSRASTAEEESPVVPGGPTAVVKVVSSKHLHKTDAGGVAVVANKPVPVASAVSSMLRKFPEAEGVLVAGFVEHLKGALGHELILGFRHDEAFGPIVSLGPGGTGVEELSAALLPGTAPSIGVLGSLLDHGGSGPFLDSSWIGRQLSGKTRGGAEIVRREVLLRWIEALSPLMAAFSDAGDRKWTIEEMEFNPLVVSSGKLIALDARLRFRHARRPPKGAARPLESVKAMLRPRSMAIAGVGQEGSIGRIILRNVLKAGFDRERLYVVKKDVSEIDGVRCHPGLSHLPEPVDLLVVSTPSSALAGVMKDAADSRKANGAVIISAGIGEKAGTEGLEAEVAAIIRGSRTAGGRLAVCGGNSLGITSVPGRMDTFFIPPYKMGPERPGSKWPRDTAFISQSGAFVIAAMSRLEWFKPRYAVSAGNQIDATLADYFECVLDDPVVRTLLVYAEGLKPGDGLRLVRLVRKARGMGKSVVFYKAGRTPEGRKAVRGHTASIAGEYPTAKAALAAAGAIVVETFDAFDDAVRTVCAFAAMKPRGNRAFFATNAGFEAAGMADSVRPGGPLQATALHADLKASLQAALAKHRLDAIIDPANPMDLTPMANDDTFLEVVDTALGDASVDMMVLSVIPLTVALKALPPGEGHQEDFRAGSVATGLGEIYRRHGKPLMFCVSSSSLYDPYAKAVEDEGIPVFRNADRAVRALEHYFVRPHST